MVDGPYHNDTHQSLARRLKRKQQASKPTRISHRANDRGQTTSYDEGRRTYLQTTVGQQARSPPSNRHHRNRFPSPRWQPWLAPALSTATVVQPAPPAHQLWRSSLSSQVLYSALLPALPYLGVHSTIRHPTRVVDASPPAARNDLGGGCFQAAPTRGRRIAA